MDLDPLITVFALSRNGMSENDRMCHFLRVSRPRKAAPNFLLTEPRNLGKKRQRY